MEQAQKQDEQYTLKSLMIAAIEKTLKDREARTKDLEDREENFIANEMKLKKATDDFYQEVSQISSRHTKEKGLLESHLQNQIGAVEGFQSEMERLRAELADKRNEIESLKKVLRGKENYLNTLMIDVAAISETTRYVDTCYAIIT